MLAWLAVLGPLAVLSSAGLTECEKNIDPYTAECDGKPYSLYELRGADSPYVVGHNDMGSAHPH